MAYSHTAYFLEDMDTAEEVEVVVDVGEVCSVDDVEDVVDEMSVEELVVVDEEGFDVVVDELDFDELDFDVEGFVVSVVDSVDSVDSVDFVGSVDSVGSDGFGMDDGTVVDEIVVDVDVFGMVEEGVGDPFEQHIVLLLALGGYVHRVLPVLPDIPDSGHLRRNKYGRCFFYGTVHILV